MLGKDYQTYEFEGLVTQLAATSEVANIGLTMTCPDGEEIEIEEWLVAIEDLSSAITARVRKFNSNNVEIRRIGDSSLDNDQMQNALAINEATSLGAGDVGSNVKEMLRKAQYIKIFVSGTLQAEKTMSFRCTYKARISEATFAVVGAGITLTTTKHDLV